MKGECLATAHWHALVGEGRDTCRLIREPDGFLLIGHTRLYDQMGESRLEYVVRCDPGFVTIDADVTGLCKGAPVAWKLTRTAEGWQVNGEPVPGSEACIDIDLGFTPATNLLPLRRLAGTLSSPTRVDAVWLRWPEGRVEVLEQRYHRIDATQVGYRSQDYDAVLAVDPSGFVTRYPGGWEGTVDAP
jgi:hypothetical protein